jgi:carboxyl-terminal processing protease
MLQRTRLLVLVLTTPLVLFTVVGGLLGQQATPPGAYPQLRVFDDVVSLIFGNYVEEPPAERVLDGALRGLSDALDPDSSFLEPEDVQVIESGEAAPAGGTGLTITRQYYLRVVAARDNSPAAAAGLRTGDYIRAINGKSTRHMTLFEGEHLLRGPVGSTATLTILRGSATDTHDVALTLTAAAPAPVTSRMANAQVGLVRVAAIGPTTPAEVRTQVAALQGQGATSLIVDIRHTAEGTPAEGIALARVFVGAGTLGIKESRGGVQEKIDAQPGDAPIALPVTLLTTNGTSRAAEVFAAALVDNGRATSVGERTLGRAAAQKLVKLPDGSGLWLTHQRWLTPKGTAIHGTGLTPEVAVAEPDVEFGAPGPTTDPILDKALEHIASPRKTDAPAA